MRYGFFTTLAEPDNRRPYAQIIRDLREQAVFCDRAGFEAVWLAEHLPYLSQRQVLDSMELFATKVMPRLGGARA